MSNIWLWILGFYIAFGVAETVHVYYHEYQFNKDINKLRDGLGIKHRPQHARPTILIITTLLRPIILVALWPLHYRHKDSWNT